MQDLRKNNDDEKWIPSTCGACFNSCGIKALVKAGKVVDIKGDPKVMSGSRGKICGKGQARIAELYDPNRITKPMKRTNPVKGIGVDPKWVEISWEEAMDTIIPKMKKIREEDPRELVIGHFDLHNATIEHAFGTAFGTPNSEYFTVSCGNGLHTLFGVTVGGINMEIDLEHCDYIVLWGSQLGHGVNNNPMVSAREMANARRRGAKLIVIDPICGHAAAKADEWIPIIPGTDAALALGMINVLVNDLGIYDREYLKKCTNSPYLIDATGHYVREKNNNKPLVWDNADGKAKEYDAQDIGDAAIEGDFTVDNVKCRPAFDLIKEHVKKNYPLDKVEKITTVPAKTIARIAKEFGEAARIGSTINIDGHQLPLRPAAVEFKKGANAHKNSFFACHCLQLLNIIVGSINVPGGVLGSNPIGPGDLWTVIKSNDGLMGMNGLDVISGGEGSYSCFVTPYPPREIKLPETVGYKELFPVSGYITTITTFVLADPERFKLPYKPKMLILARTNFVASTSEPEKTAKVLTNMEFILGFAWKTNETLEFADIILPEAHDLERYWMFPANMAQGFLKFGPGDWYFQICQPVVEPPPGIKDWNNTLIEIAERLGIMDEFNNRINVRTGLGMMEDLALKPKTKYTVGDITKRMAKMAATVFGKEITADTFTEKDPFLNLGKKTVREAYTGPFTNSDAKVPVYFEHFIDVGKKVEKVTRDAGMGWWDVSHYNPMPEWRPCPAFEEDGREFDLFIAASKVPLHYHTTSADNAWINDISSRNRMDYNVLVNTETAKKKGIENGDMIIIESRVGKIEGKVKVTELVHPQVVAMFGMGGHWSKGQPIAKGKGMNMNSLIPFDFNNMETLSGQMDTCARVKIYKEAAI
jgi:anaerobic selenocysteine-containing dehydrogenase